MSQPNTNFWWPISDSTYWLCPKTSRSTYITLQNLICSRNFLLTVFDTSSVTSSNVIKRHQTSPKVTESFVRSSKVIASHLPRHQTVIGHGHQSRSCAHQPRTPENIVHGHLEILRENLRAQLCIMIRNDFLLARDSTCHNSIESSGQLFHMPANFSHAPVHAHPV